MSDVEGVVLDVDDTLYLERDYVRSGFAHIDRWLNGELGIEGVGAKAWQLFLGGVRNTTIGDALIAVVGDAGLLDACVIEYRNHSPNITLLADAREFLLRIPSDLPIAVVTDGPALSQRAKCRALGLYDIANRIVLTEELQSSKPDPAVFRAAVKGWNVPANKLMYVADNPHKDFAGPLQLGWRAVRVRRPDSLHVAMPTPVGVEERSALSGLAIRGEQ